MYVTTRRGGDNMPKTSLRTPLQIRRGSVVHDVIDAGLLLLLLLLLRRRRESSPAGVTDATVAVEVRVPEGGPGIMRHGIQHDSINYRMVRHVLVFSAPPRNWSAPKGLEFER